jgi:catechol 2,3-dioxygenase
MTFRRHRPDATWHHARQTIYFFDPAGNRNEVFFGGFIYYPDNPKRSWSIDKIGKAVFYYQRELNERFMSVVT